MNRRSFTFGLGALAAAPAVPIPSLAKAMPAITPAALEYFDWAKMIVRAHNKCSPAMLQRLLKLEPTMALEVQSALLKEGVITMPGLNGMSEAVDPMYRDVFRNAGGTDISQADAAPEAKDPKLSTQEGSEPEENEDATDDPVPASHADAEELPGDLVASDDRSCEDIVEEL